MTKDRALEIWAPPESVWSRFTRSVLFSFMEERPAHPPENAVREWDVPLQTNTAIFVDAPSSEGVAIGLSLAARGYRPIPLYNACPFAAALWSPEPHLVPSVVEVTLIMASLFDDAETLSGCRLPASAPPAFLLDANRSAARPGSVNYEYFDNRSFVSVLDVPAATFLKEHDITRTVVVHDKPKLQPDLLSILLEWQCEGTQIFFQSSWKPWGPQPIVLKRPSTLVSIYRRLAMRYGYRRDNPGAFGALVQPTNTSG